MTIVLLKNAHLSCKITTRGGAILDFDYRDGKKTQHLMRPTLGENTHLVTHQASWPLVPFSNRINLGKFQWRGEDYQVPTNWLGGPNAMHVSHGQAWAHEWEITAKDARSCRMSLDFDAPRYWPWHYQAEQEFVLSSEALTVRLSVTNKDTEEMPAGLGLHPYFPRPKGTIFKAAVKGLWLIDKNVIPTKRVAVPGKFNFAKGKKLDGIRLDHCFDGYGGEMEIIWPKKPVKLRVTSSDNLQHLVVYTASSTDDFFCAEPVSHMPDAINRKGKTGLVALKSGQSLAATYRFAIESA